MFLSRLTISGWNLSRKKLSIRKLNMCLLRSKIYLICREIIHIPKDVEYIIHNGQRIRNKMYGENIASHTYVNGMPPAASRL